MQTGHALISLLNPFILIGFYHNSSDQAPIAGCLLDFINMHFIQIPLVNANSVDPNQMPCSVASILVLHCLPVTLLWVSRLQWVKHLKTFIQWK